MKSGKLYSDPRLRLNDQEWLTGYGTLERLNATAKDTSFLQNITDFISKGVLENIFQRKIQKVIQKMLNKILMRSFQPHE